MGIMDRVTNIIFVLLLIIISSSIIKHTDSKVLHDMVEKIIDKPPVKEQEVMAKNLTTQQQLYIIKAEH